jgi:diguanylate cyclase (GGDEF)-like protein
MSGEHAPHVCLRTGAFRRPHFERLLAEAVAAARAARLPLAVLWLDMDEAHEALDAHGDAALEAGLSALAEEAARVLDGRGPLGRVDDDAFATFLFAVERDVGERLAHAVRRQVGARALSAAGVPWRLTVSVGVAWLRAGEPYGNLLEAAEAACIQAKQAGRNRVVVR